MTDRMLDNARHSPTGQLSGVARARWHVRRAYAALAQGDSEAAVAALEGADALLAALELDEDAGRLRAA